MAYGLYSGALRPPAAVQPDCLHRVPDYRLLDMLALRTFKRQKVGMGGTGSDPGASSGHDTKGSGAVGWKAATGGMTIGFGHDAFPALGGSGTLAVTGRPRYEGR
jgi:hypothetical protein